MGLYFKSSIVFLYIPLIAVYFISKKIHNKSRKFYFLSPKRYLKYFKLLVNKKVLILVVLSSIISNSIVIFQNNKYELLYKNTKEIEGEAIVISNKKEKEYYYLYKIKIIFVNESNRYKNTNLYLKMSKKKSENLEYGDKIKFTGEFIESEVSRNFGGFNYKEYLKNLKIFGSVKASNIELIKKDEVNYVFKLSNLICMKIEKTLDELLERDISGVVKGIILGEKSDIDEDIQENFRISGISHILAVSGMHVSYIIMAINIFLKKKFGKRKTKFFIIIFLLFYMFLTGFSPSIVRASLMGILMLGSGLFHRKNDIATSISLSLLIILIYNPFLLENVGLQFSYIATIGIILLQKNTKKFFKNIKIKKRKLRYRFRLNIKSLKFISKVQDILAVTISAQIAILPIMLYHFNMFGTYFLISNLVISVIIGPVLIFSLLTILLNFIFIPIAKFFTLILKMLVRILFLVSKISEIPFSKLYFPTPSIFVIVLYYVFLFIFNILFVLYNSQKINATRIRARNIIALIKYRVTLNKNNILKIITIIILILIIFKIIPQNLQINFVDVGQGDCTFITTPIGKTILIDGGGSKSNNYDVGKSTLLPYILDRGYTKIDYIIISHFDQDHVRPES